MTSADPGAVGIRDAADGDMAAVQRIYAHHVRTGVATFEEVAPSIDDLLARRATTTALGLPYLVAELAGQVVGYAYAGPYRARAAYRHTVENSIYVAPDLSGRGIGAALLAALVTRCEAGRWRQMLAIIGGADNHASIALHRRLGFRHVGTLHAVGFKLGRWVDTVVMQRTLGAGDSLSPHP